MCGSYVSHGVGWSLRGHVDLGYDELVGGEA